MSCSSWADETAPTRTGWPKSCAGRGVETHHLEHAGEVKREHLCGGRRIGIAAGASTPHWIIEAVCERIREVLREAAGA